MSLDGYIAGPKGEADWIVADPEMDFGALPAQFDTILVRRRTFETMVRARRTRMSGMRTVVLSTTLRREDHPEVTMLGEETERAVAELRTGPGKDVWLFAGGGLYRRLSAAGLVDRVEVAVEPFLLGAGVPLLPSPAGRRRLDLRSHRVSKSGIVHVDYAVVGSGA